MRRDIRREKEKKKKRLIIIALLILIIAIGDVDKWQRKNNKKDKFRQIL